MSRIAFRAGRAVLNGPAIAPLERVTLGAKERAT